MIDPLNGKLITGLSIIYAIGDHMGETPLKPGQGWKVDLTTAAFEILQHDMPTVLSEDDDGEYVWAWDRFNRPFSAFVKIAEIRDDVPWIIYDTPAPGVTRIWRTYGARRYPDHSGIKIV